MIQRADEKPRAVVESLPSPPSSCNLQSFLVNTKEPSPSAPRPPSPDPNSSGLSSINSNSSYVPSNEPRFLESDTPVGLEPPIPQERSIPEMKLVPFREESSKVHQSATTPTFSLLPSLRFCSIPRHLDTPLSSWCPEYLQVSNTTSSELDFKLCASSFFGCYTQQELTPLVQPPRWTNAIETVWVLFPRSQTRCHTA